jgi:hypothetical protein
MSNTSLNYSTNDFLKNLRLCLDLKNRIRKVENPIETTKAASSLALVYEAARNAVEFRAEHLIRQAAIERILKRRLFLNQKSQKLSSLLIKELIWARYIKAEFVSKEKVDEVALVIEKYRALLSDGDSNGVSKRILEIASCEIEAMLAFDPLPQVVSNYVFDSLKERINFEEEDPKVKDVQIYIAVERGFGKNTDGFIAYKLLKTLLPSWFDKNVDVEKNKFEFYKTLSFIDSQFKYPLADILRREVLFYSAPFNLIYEMVKRYDSDFIEISKNRVVLNQKAKAVLEDLYRELKDKLSRASVRSIIYIFLTKVIIGILLEFPIDLLFGQVNYLAIGINLSFPPLLMFLLNLDIKIPDEENSERIINLIDEYFYSEGKPKVKFVSRKVSVEKIKKFFWFLYIFMYGVTFGGIVWLLTKLGFNPVSQLIFLFFLCVVSFFAYRVRGITKDYSLESERESFISSIKDFIFLPVIKVGQWLSSKIASLNVLSFVLDFIIEAPLKVFLEVFEDWIHFVKEKKEEIVS